MIKHGVLSQGIKHVLEPVKLSMEYSQYDYAWSTTNTIKRGVQPV